MGKVTRAHSKSYSEPPELQSHIEAIQAMIAYIRDSPLPMSSKKRMLNHAIWEVSHARGNFNPRYRSKDVVNSAKGTKIERDHVFKRKQIVLDILSKQEPLEDIIERTIHCVVTEAEHSRLTNISKEIDGWERYSIAGVEGEFPT